MCALLITLITASAFLSIHGAITAPPTGHKLILNDISLQLLLNIQYLPLMM